MPPADLYELARRKLDACRSCACGCQAAPADVRVDAVELVRMTMIPGPPVLLCETTCNRCGAAHRFAKRVDRAELEEIRCPVK